MSNYPKTRDELITDVKDSLLMTTKLKDVTQGSIIRNILEEICSETSKINNIGINSILASHISKANGIELDLIGKVFNVERKEPQPIEDETLSNFRFYIDPIIGKTAQQLVGSAIYPGQNISKGIPFIIPRGIQISSNELGITGQTTSDAIFFNDDIESYASIEVGGIVPIGALNEHSFTLIKGIRCENTMPLDTAITFIESDDEYRFRLSNSVLASERANETAVRLAALSVHGVNNVIIDNIWDGIGTFRLFITSSDVITSDNLLRKVREEVDKVCAKGIKYFIDRPNYIGVDMDINIQTQLSIPEIKTNLKHNIGKYINTLEIGQELVINEIIRIILDDKRIKDYQIYSLCIGEINPITKAFDNPPTPVYVTNQKLFETEKWIAKNISINVV